MKLHERQHTLDRAQVKTEPVLQQMKVILRN